MATAETVRPADLHNYLWWFPGSPLKIHLALNVVLELKNRLSADGPEHAEEGLLFGVIRNSVTDILDFQPSPDRNLPGLMGKLPADEMSSVVGYYRTDSRESFRLTEQDRALAKEHFRRPFNVFLIIHPSRFGPASATFFFHDRDCRLADFALLEFPFEPALLASEQSARVRRSQQVQSLALVPEQPLAYVPEPSLTYVSERQRAVVSEPVLAYISERQRAVIPESALALVSPLAMVAEPVVAVAPEESVAIVAEPAVAVVSEEPLAVVAVPVLAVVSPLAIVAEPMVAVVSEESLDVVAEPVLAVVSEESLGAVPEIAVAVVPEKPLAAVAEPVLAVVSEKPLAAAPETAVVTVPEMPLAITPQPAVAATEKLPAVREETPPPPFLLQPRRAKPNILLTVLVWVLSLLAGGGISVLFNNDLFRQRCADTWQAIATLGATMPSWFAHSTAAPQPSISLQVIRHDGSLALTWDHESPTIAAATSGSLLIHDGDKTRSISFDAARLRDGSFMYVPNTDQILMQLTVKTPAASHTESVTVLLSSAKESPAGPVQPSRLPAGAAGGVSSPSERVAAVKPALFGSENSSSPHAPTRPFGPTAPPAQTWMRPPALLQSVPKTMGPAAEANEPPSLASATSMYQPAVAILQVQPEFPEGSHPQLTNPLTVEVNVTIDENGKVTQAQAIPQRGMSQLMMNSVVKASLLWRFKPALHNREPVASESILKFVFNPTN